jgi:NADPH:quinone reductase-like Zn-dependent oxidoreductase
MEQTALNRHYEQDGAHVPGVMRAWRVRRFGGPDDLHCEDAPVPAPRGSEVLVKVQAAGLNPVDLKTLQGRYPMIGQADLPYTLGRDVAGMVVKRTDTLKGWEPGQRVCAFVGQGQGTFADYVAVPASALANVPEGIGVDTMAAVPLAALTAWQGLFDHGRLEAGERVLIHGASGGVGRFAVQFARHCGAHVTVTASEATHDDLRELGADEIIDYHAQRFEETTGDIDLVFDLVGGSTQARSWDVLKPGGTLISTLADPSQAEALSRSVHAGRYTARPDGAQLEHIVGLLEHGVIRVDVVGRYAFEAIDDAFARIARAHLHGKLVAMHDWS